LHPDRVAVIARTEEEPTSIFAPALRPTSAGLLIVITLIAFEGMAVAAALPTAARAVHGLGAYGWTFTGFLVANIVAMAVAGQISDARGPRLPLVAGLVCFVCGLLLAGTATTMVQLVAGRVVQGLGSGLLITAVYVVAGEAYAEHLRPKLFAGMSSAWVLPSLIGPAAAGLLAQHASWRWVFLGIAPFVVIGGAMLVPVLRTLQPRAGKRSLADPLKLVRAAAVAIAIAALEQAGQHLSPVSVPLAVVGVVLLAWGLSGLLPPGTLRVRPGVSAPVALRGLLAGSMFGAEVSVPLGLSVQHGYGATAAGLPLTLSGISWAFGSWVQGRADDSRGPQVRVRLIRSGFACMTGAIALMTVALLPGSSGLLAYPAWLLAGLGAGLTMSSVGVLLLKFTTDARRGADSAAMQLSDATAAALTTGLAGVFVAAAASGALGFTAAFVAVDLVMCAIAAVGVAVAGRARPA
jgi:MFS family permease